MHRWLRDTLRSLKCQIWEWITREQHTRECQNANFYSSWFLPAYVSFWSEHSAVQCIKWQPNVIRQMPRFNYKYSNLQQFLDVIFTRWTQWTAMYKIVDSPEDCGKAKLHPEQGVHIKSKRELQRRKPFTVSVHLSVHRHHPEHERAKQHNQNTHTRRFLPLKVQLPSTAIFFERSDSSEFICANLTEQLHKWHLTTRGVSNQALDTSFYLRSAVWQLWQLHLKICMAFNK